MTMQENEIFSEALSNIAKEVVKEVATGAYNTNNQQVLQKLLIKQLYLLNSNLNSLIQVIGVQASLTEQLINDFEDATESIDSISAIMNWLSESLKEIATVMKETSNIKPSQFGEILLNKHKELIILEEREQKIENEVDEDDDGNE